VADQGDQPGALRHRLGEQQDQQEQPTGQGGHVGGVEVRRPEQRHQQRRDHESAALARPEPEDAEDR